MCCVPYLIVRGGGVVLSELSVDCGRGVDMDNNPGGKGFEPRTEILNF